MKKKSRALNLAVASLVIPAVPALATPVTISDSLSINQVLDGSSTSLQFDVSSLLSAQGLSPTDILSGNLIVYGYSNIDYANNPVQTYSAYGVGSTSYRSSPRTGYGSYYSWWSGTSYYSYTYYVSVRDTFNYRDHDTNYLDDVVDTITVSAGSTSASDAVDTRTTSRSYTGTNYNYSTGSYYSGLNHYFTSNYNNYDQIFGALEVSLTLDNLALMDISADGILDFGVNATIGQFSLTSAQLTISAEKQNNYAVPEPGTLSLIGLAIALAAGNGMRRRKRTDG